MVAQVMALDMVEVAVKVVEVKGPVAVVLLHLF